MKSFTLKSGEKAYVPTEFEKKLYKIALRQLQVTLPVVGEGLDG